LSEATPSGYEMGVKASGTPAGAQAAYAALSSVGVVAETLLNHRLLAAMPPASSRSKSVINGREEYIIRAEPGEGTGLHKSGKFRLSKGTRFSALF